MITEFYKINTIENPKLTLCYGNNTELIEYAMNSIFEHGYQAKFYNEDEFITHYQSILSPSLFDDFSNTSGKIKAIIIQEVSDKYYDVYQKITSQQKTIQNCVIYMFATKLRSTSKIVQFFTKESGVFAVKFYDINHDIKAKIIQNECRMQSITTTTDLINFLQKIPLNQLVDEVKKASIFLGNATKDNKNMQDNENISEYIELSIQNHSKNGNTNIPSNFVYDFASGNLSTIEYIKEFESIYVIRSLISHFLSLLEARELFESGKSVEIITKELNIFFKNEKIFQEQIAKYNMEKIGKILENLNNLELKAKSSYNVSKERDFINLLFNIRSF